MVTVNSKEVTRSLELQGYIHPTCTKRNIKWSWVIRTHLMTRKCTTSLDGALCDRANGVNAWTDHLYSAPICQMFIWWVYFLFIIFISCFRINSHIKRSIFKRSNFITTVQSNYFIAWRSEINSKKLIRNTVLLPHKSRLQWNKCHHQ